RLRIVCVRFTLQRLPRRSPLNTHLQHYFHGAQDTGANSTQGIDHRHDRS
ncbi:21831_t:CDS:2, partial [Racocetra persica]